MLKWPCAVDTDVKIQELSHSIQVDAYRFLRIAPATSHSNFFLVIAVSNPDLQELTNFTAALQLLLVSCRWSYTVFDFLFRIKHVKWMKDVCYA